MLNLPDALAEVGAIRVQLARSTAFQGYGPATVSATGLLALGLALLQSRLPGGDVPSVEASLWVWMVSGLAALTLVGIDTVARARRLHAGMAPQMLHIALEPCLPPVVAGVLLTGVLWRYAPREEWMLPGLWEVLVSLAVFASCRCLPRPIFGIGVWYLSAGMVCLAVSVHGTFSPWEMGIPFGVGQLLVAAILQQGYREQR